MKGDFDHTEFESFLLVEAGPRGDGWATSTVEVTMRRLDFALAHGLNLDAMREDPEREGRAYLAGRKKAGKGTHALNNDIKLLNALADYFGHGRPFTKITEPRSQYRSLSDDELRELLSWHHEDRATDRLWRGVMTTYAVTAMRPSELAALTVDDVDLDQLRVYIREPAKDGLRRHIPLEPWTATQGRPLGAYMRWRRKLDVDHDALWVTNRRGSLGTGPYNPCSNAYLRLIPYYIGQDVGIDCNATILRHTRATQLRRRGWDLLALRAYLGHADVSSTQIYAEVRPDDLDALLDDKPVGDPFQRHDE